MAQIVFDPVVACPFIAGAQTLLNRALGRVDMYLISGTPHEELVEIVRARGLGRFFKSMHGAPTGKPEAFKRILEKGRYKPEQTLAVGDSITEYDAAAGLGIPFLGIVAPEFRALLSGWHRHQTIAARCRPAARPDMRVL